jgi:hypothetical protein
MLNTCPGKFAKSICRFSSRASIKQPKKSRIFSVVEKIKALRAMGRRQAVSHGILVPVFAGSNPAAPTGLEAGGFRPDGTGGKKDIERSQSWSLQH